MNDKVTMLSGELSVIQSEIRALRAQLKPLEEMETGILDKLHQEQSGIFIGERLLVTQSVHNNMKLRGWASPWPVGDGAVVMSVGKTEATVVWCYDGDFEGGVHAGIATVFSHALVRNMRDAYASKFNA